MVNILCLCKNELFKTDLCEQITSVAPDFSCNDEEKPDIIILDEDISQLASLKEQYERTPIFVLLKKGIKKQNDTPFLKYISKPFALNDILNLIQSVLNIILSSDAGILTFNGYELSPLEKEIKNLQTQKKVKLTEREVKMILYLYKMKGESVDKHKFLQEVWGYHPDVSTHTIETHIYRLRQKVEKSKGSPALISTSNGGYKLNF